MPSYDSITNRQNGQKMGFSRVGYIYEPQIFNSTYEQKLVQVQPFSTTKVRTSIVQTISLARFTATFTVQCSQNGSLVQFKVPGEVSFTEHRFEYLAQPDRDCCGCNCAIF